MDDRDRVLALFLDELGISESDLQGFEGRKCLQKAIYLLQQPPFKLDFGFRYNLYIRGPYSPELADSGYRLLGSMNEWKQVRTERRLIKECVENIGQLKSHFARPEGGLDSDLLELAATVHFLAMNTFRHLQDTDALAQAREWVRRMKPDLAPCFDKAVEKLTKLQMIPSAA